MKSDYDYLDGKFSEDHVFSRQDVVYCMGQAQSAKLKQQAERITYLERQNKGFQEQYNDSGKLVNGLRDNIKQQAEEIERLKKQIAAQVETINRLLEDIR